jgi:hypothetical protein
VGVDTGGYVARQDTAVEAVWKGKKMKRWVENANGKMKQPDKYYQRGLPSEDGKRMRTGSVAEKASIQSSPMKTAAKRRFARPPERGLPCLRRVRRVARVLPTKVEWTS